MFRCRPPEQQYRNPLSVYRTIRHESRTQTGFKPNLDESFTVKMTSMKDLPCSHSGDAQPITRHEAAKSLNLRDNWQRNELGTQTAELFAFLVTARG